LIDDLSLWPLLVRSIFSDRRLAQESMHRCGCINMYLDAATNQDKTKRQQDRRMGVGIWLGKKKRLRRCCCCMLVLASIPYAAGDDGNGGFACGGGVEWSGGGFLASRPLHCNIPARHPLESLRFGERSGSVPPTSHYC
jgi:hypothetical protein